MQSLLFRSGIAWSKNWFYEPVEPEKYIHIHNKILDDRQMGKGLNQNLFFGIPRHSLADCRVRGKSDLEISLQERFDLGTARQAGDFVD